MNLSAEKQFRIGLSLPFTAAAEMDALTDLPEIFELLELRGELAAEAALLKKNHPVVQEFTRLDFRDLMPAALTAALSGQHRSIVLEYKKKLREMFALASNCNTAFVSIDPDWENLCADPEKLAVFNDVLQSTAGDREYFDLTLLVAVRVPGSGSMNINKSLDLLHKTSSYRVKLVLDINPHELLKSELDWQSVLAPFRFEVPVVRFCYHSELGNKLLYPHIEKVITAMRSWQQPAAIYLAPGGCADLDELAAMAENINLPTGEK